MEDNATQGSDGGGFIGKMMGKVGLEMNAKNGIIIAISIILILYVLYAYVYPRFTSSSEGVETDKSGKKKKKSGGKSKDKNDDADEISDLVDKIESKQDRNLS